MMWISVEDVRPKYKKRVLLGYFKNKLFVITEGWLEDTALDLARESHPAEFWRQHGRGETYVDYAGRQIQNLMAKNSKNKVTHWMELPKQPK